MQPYLHKNFTGNITKLILLSLIILQSVEATERLRIATTTSTENSGLLNLLNPAFEQKYSIALDVIAVGSGKALRLAENGDVDLIFVHAPAAEIGFIKAGYGIERESVMHNDFVVLGAPTDPANINNADSLAQVMLKIHNASSTFISRGDDSGTHNKEMELWQSAKLSPAGTWYLSVGQGMGAVLQIANEKLAYTLTDRGTYLAFMDKIELQILYEQDPALFNRYHIILVNPQRHAHTRIESARKYSAFIRSEIGQNLIRDFRINGEPLFYPDVIK
jgi:tungstate transport system substrate-binding protein